MATVNQPHTTNRSFLKSIYTPEVQTIGKQKITLKENHDWKVDAEGKSKEYHSLGQSILRVLGTAEGLFRFGQLMERAPKFVNAVRQEYGMSRLAPLDSCASKSVAAWTWLTTIPRVITMTPGVIADVKDAAAAWNDKSLNSQQRQYKFEKAAREMTDAVAMYGHGAADVASLFPSLAKFGAASTEIAAGATLVHDTVSIKMNAQNYLHARAVDLTRATPAIKETVKGTEKQALIALAKDVVAFTSGFFSMLFLATGTAILPGIAFVTMSLSATVFAVMRKLYEETMNFKPINFLDPKSVTWVIA